MQIVAKGVFSQATKAAWSLPVSAITEAANQIVRGISAIADRRSAHHSPAPFLDDPSASAWFSGVGVGTLRIYPTPIQMLTPQVSAVSRMLATTTAHPEA